MSQIVGEVKDFHDELTPKCVSTYTLAFTQAPTTVPFLDLPADVWRLCFVRSGRLLASGLDESRLEAVRAPLGAALATRTDTCVDKVKETVAEKQKELSRSIAPQVRAAMLPAYQRGFAEAGTGSHRRRVAVVPLLRGTYMFKKPFNLPLLFGFGPLMTYAFLGADRRSCTEGEQDNVCRSCTACDGTTSATVLLTFCPSFPVWDSLVSDNTCGQNAMLPLRQDVQKLVRSICVESTMTELQENYGMLWEATTVPAPGNVYV